MLIGPLIRSFTMMGVLVLDSTTSTNEFGPVPGKFLSIVGQDPSDSKFNRLHVDIFRFCFFHFRYIL